MMVTRAKALPSFQEEPEIPGIPDAPAPRPAVQPVAPLPPAGPDALQWAIFLAQQLGRTPWQPRVLNQDDADDLAEGKRLAATHRFSLLPHAARFWLVELDIEGALLHQAPTLAEAAYQADQWFSIALGDGSYEVHLAAILAAAHTDFPTRPDVHHWRPRPGSITPQEALERMKKRGEPLPRLRPQGYQRLGNAVPFSLPTRRVAAPIAAPVAPDASDGFVNPLDLLSSIPAMPVDLAGDVDAALAELEALDQDLE